ncbi:cytochrome p450 protein [Paramyrothecium foliicola]|nr:cytochrome p450 protein [Paramyrothecium foliicola]
MSEFGSAYHVHLGVWTNWSYGPMLGKTLTVTNSIGAVLIALIALYVTLAGAQLWRIFCFLFHSIYSNPEPQDALHNQRQAILRNSISPINGCLEFLKVALAWRQLRVQSFRRILPIMLAAFIIATGTVATSALSSRVSLGNEVLVKGDQCGLMPFHLTSLDNLLFNLWPYYSRAAEDGADYAQRCYGNQSTATDCGTLPRPSLPMTIDLKAGCPFDDALCLSSDANILVDTGLIDSHRDLGLNFPKSSAFQYRQKLHCAPLETEGYRSIITQNGFLRNKTFEESEGHLRNETYASYYYGPNIDPNDTKIVSDLNATYQIYRDFVDTGTIKSGMSVRVTSAYYDNGSIVEMSPSALFASHFAPIAEFNRTDGDVHIVWLIPNFTLFAQKSPDLLYRAITPVEGSDLGLAAGTLWVQAEEGWPLGCVNQHQFCSAAFPKDRSCTGLRSFHDVLSQIDELTDVVEAGKTAKWIVSLLAQAADFARISILDAKALTSRLWYTARMCQVKIEQNQWQLEVENWFSIALASLQLQLLGMTTAPKKDFVDLGKFSIQPTDAGKIQVCQGQRIHSTNFTSFSLFGLLLIFILGFFIILAALTIETLAFYIQKAFRRRTYASLEWRATQKLHLQRLAHEGLGFGEWRLGVLDIPVTMSEDKLGVLDLSDADSPRLLNVKDGRTTPETV